MKQRINLYLAVPKHFAVKLPAKMILSLCVFFFIVLLSVYVYEYWQINTLNNEIRKFDLRRQEISEKVVQLTKKYTKDPEIIELSKKIEALKREIIIKTHIFPLLFMLL